MISVVMLVAYDYRYAYQAIERVYPLADEIVLGLDRARVTWTKQPFTLNEEEFRSRLAGIDGERKITIVEEDFHTEDHPFANETRERNILSGRCRPGNWLLQIDSDEYLLNPAEFVSWLPSADPSVDFRARWLTVFKTFGRSCLVIQTPPEVVEVGTTSRSLYVKGRRTQRPAVQSNMLLLHHSWGRTRPEIEQKLHNWGHARDFDVGKFLGFWDSVSLTNYTRFVNFHPLHGPLWAKLDLVTLPPEMLVT